MSKELYLHTLQQLRDGCKAEHMDTEAAALDAAIAALSCDGDCISRQAAIDIASGYCHPANIADELAKLPSAQPEPRNKNNAEVISILSDMRSRYNCFDPEDEEYYRGLSEAIKALSAQPERKTGKWHLTDAYHHWLCCDQCHKKMLPNVEWVEKYNIPTNYCPNCGAAMIKGEKQ